MRSIACGWIVTTAFVTASTVSVRPSAAGTEYTCNEIHGFVSINGLTVEPPQPRVGDQVTLQFDVDYRVYSVSSLTLLGTEPLLEGETLVFGDRTARFQLEATQPGMTSVTLQVRYENEEICVNDDGQMFFQGGIYRTVTSQPHTVVIAPGGSCVGDCDGDGRVTVDELIRVSMIALGLGGVGSCTHGNLPGDSVIDVDDLVTIINYILGGCP